MTRATKAMEDIGKAGKWPKDPNDARRLIDAIVSATEGLEMKTKTEIQYKAAPYGYVATIPAGTPVVPATNLPDKNQYWAEPWEGMSEQAESWGRNYGFLLFKDEVTK